MYGLVGVTYASYTNAVICNYNGNGHSLWETSPATGDLLRLDNYQYGVSTNLSVQVYPSVLHQGHATRTAFKNRMLNGRDSGPNGFAIS
jgi:hypothetical protein